MVVLQFQSFQHLFVNSDLCFLQPFTGCICIKLVLFLIENWCLLVLSSFRIVYFVQSYNIKSSICFNYIRCKFSVFESSQHGNNLFRITGGCQIFFAFLFVLFLFVCVKGSLQSVVILADRFYCLVKISFRIFFHFIKDFLRIFLFGLNILFFQVRCTDAYIAERGLLSLFIRNVSIYLGYDGIMHSHLISAQLQVGFYLIFCYRKSLYRLLAVGFHKLWCSLCNGFLVFLSYLNLVICCLFLQNVQGLQILQRILYSLFSIGSAAFCLGFPDGISGLSASHKACIHCLCLCLALANHNA